MGNISLQEMDDETINVLRKKCLRSLYCFAVAVMGYDDITEELHGKVCTFLQRPGRRKQVTLPRSFVKTWLCTIAFSIWIALPRVEADEFPEGIPVTDKLYTLGTNIRVLIASNVISNAHKILSLIRKTYERNTALQILFPEVIPDNFNKTKWSDSEACINRSEDFTESTFEAGGVGGSTVSRHYDIIIEDDLIYAKKDDLSGKELQPDQDDIDKAIGWHKLAMSLLVPGSHTRIHNIGTRWAKHDLVHYIRSNESEYEYIEYAITKDATYEGEPTWKELYPREEIKRIREAQGPYMFATQYLNKPTAPEDHLFDKKWLQFYINRIEVPKDIRIFTTVDLSLWDETKVKRKGRQCDGVVLTCAWDSNNHVWLLHYDKGRFDPSEMIDLFYKHNKLFKPEGIHVESVYYQKSLVHFTRKEMEKRGWLPIRELKQETNVSKELRIRALEPIMSNLAIHCRTDHKEFITEVEDYIPSSNCPKDILDTLAMQIQVARPGEVSNDEVTNKRSRIPQHFGVDMDSFLTWAENRNKNFSTFADQMPEDGYMNHNEIQEATEFLSPIIDPNYSTMNGDTVKVVPVYPVIEEE